MCDPGERASQAMYREFLEEALSSDTMSLSDKEGIKRRLNRLFSGGEEVPK